MKLVIRLGLVCATAACVFLVACQREPASSSTSTPAVARQAVDKALANQLVATPAWLHERLPDDTIAYIRIPSPWSLISAPDGRALDPLFASEAHAKMIDAIKQGFASDPLIARTGWQPVIKLLLSDLSSPLEVAVIGANKIASPASSLLVSLRVRYADVGGLNGTIEKLGSAQTVQLKTPFDAGSGDGELAVGGKSVFAHFDAATQRVTLLAGMTATAAALTSELKALAQPRAHPMQASEAKIDQSGQGLFVWLSVEAFRSAASMALNGPDKKLANDLVSQTRSASLGWGTVDGKGRVSFLLDAPGAKLLRYLPRSAKQTTLQTAGEPQWAIAMSLPTAAELAQFEAALGEDFGASGKQELTSALDKMRARLGFDLADLLGAFGPEVVGVSDASGRYTAVRLRDAAKFDALVKQLVDRFKLDHQTRNIGGASFHYLLLPSFAQMENAASAAASPWLELYQRVGTHLYWIEQDGNLLFANIPQTLMDYRAAKTHTPLAAWLTKQQGLDAAQALLAATVRTNGAQRSVYSAYLVGLQILADIAGTHIDMFTLPSADALQLPRDGALGLQLHASNDDLGVDFIFEQAPLEALGNTGGGMTAVAVVAILAAIALPAYQDYTVRSHVSEGLVLGDAVKTAIAEYYLRRRGLPHDLAAVGVSAPPVGRYVQSIRVEDGVVVITYTAAAGAGLDGHTLKIAPYANAQGEIRWQCGSAAAPAGTHPLAAQRPDTGEPVPQKYLPSNCRQ
jgi:Tfp pilus assembly major pilin PilA